MESSEIAEPNHGPGRRGLRVGRRLIRPISSVTAGVGLAVLAQLPDRLPYNVLLVSLVVAAVVDTLWTRRRERILRGSEHDAERRLAEAERHLGELVERLPAAVYRDRYRRDDGAFLEVDYVSPQMEQLSGYTVDDFMSTPDLWTSLVHPDDRDRVFAVNVQRHLAGAGLEQEYRVIRRDGRVIWVREEARVVDSPDSDTILTHGLLTDITDRKILEQQLSHQAFHDTLTGLPNRALFHDRLQNALASRTRVNRTAVLFLDLDGFKAVNDSLGHAAGDRLLNVVASRLQSTARPGDTIARLGGDEFAVLLDDVASGAAAAVVAERLLAALREPVEIDGRRLSCRASLGIAMAGIDGATPAELLRNADAAMYRAKAEHRGTAVLFEPGIHAEALARFDLEAELRTAIGKGELHLAYQPIITLGNGRVEGAEALARWNHPTRGPIPPSVFVPIAEESDLILEVGGWVLAEACRQTASWLRDRVVSADFVMSVNVSAKQLTDTLPASIGSLLAATGLPARNLTIEVTESSVMRDATAAIALLQRIRALGVTVAMDDFGTGYSSLGHLRTLPIDTVKIDRSFVSGVDRPFEAALIRAVVDLARVLKLRTVAEGVETEMQAIILGTLDCAMGQGYLFGRPVPPAQFRTLMSERLAA